MIDGSIGNEHSCTTCSLDSTNANKEESLEVNHDDDDDDDDEGYNSCDHDQSQF